MTTHTLPEIYVWIPNSWGLPSPDPDEEIALRAFAQEWLAEHAPTYITVYVQGGGRDYAPGLYHDALICNRLVQPSHPRYADLWILCSRAWEATLQHDPDHIGRTDGRPS